MMKILNFFIILLVIVTLSRADTLVMRNGMKLEGTFKGGTEKMIKFETGGNLQEVTLSEVQSVTFTAPAPKAEAAPAAVPAAAAAIPAAAVSGDVKSIPAGTKMMVNFTKSVNTKEYSAGSKFKVELEQNLLVDGVIVAPKGALVYGTVLESIGGRRVGNQRIVVTFDQLSVNNQMVSIKTDDLGAEGGRGGAARKIGAAALIGGAAGNAGAGAAVGAGLVMLSGGNHIEIAPGTITEVSIKEAVTLP